MATWKNIYVGNPGSVIVNWPSLLVALLVDSAVVWVPGVAVLMLVPGYRLIFPLCLVLASVATISALYARGSTLGTWLGGFQLRTRQDERPGWKYGLVLAMVNVACIPVLAVLAVASFSPGKDLSNSLGRPESHPIRGERISRRRFLQAFDDYWARWSN